MGKKYVHLVLGWGRRVQALEKFWLPQTHHQPGLY